MAWADSRGRDGVISYAGWAEPRVAVSEFRAWFEQQLARDRPERLLLVRRRLSSHSSYLAALVMRDTAEGLATKAGASVSSVAVHLIQDALSGSRKRHGERFDNAEKRFLEALAEQGRVVSQRMAAHAVGLLVLGEKVGV